MKKIATNRGFSFIETLVGITILLIGISMPIVLVYRTLQATYAARNEMKASYLAEEGMELVRYVRDSNVLAHAHGGTNGWLDGLTGCVSTGNGCQVNSPLNTVSGGGPKVFNTCGGSGCQPVKYSASDGLYERTGPGAYATQFTRTIFVDVDPTNANEADVNVIVAWQPQGGGPVKTTKLEEHLFNWTGL